MTIRTDITGLTAFVLVLASWLAFVAIFFWRKNAPKVEQKRKAPAARLGIALESCAYAVVWIFRRPVWWPFSSFAGEVTLAVVAVALAWGSAWWCLWSIRTLGKQWTVAARVVEGHELITAGPYAIVRNPIYLGMFGYLVATGLVVSRWWALAAAAIVFLIGNEIRIRSEERLLREEFGPKFEEYTRRVPAFLPRV